MTANSTPANPADAGGSRPVPDPTVLTIDTILREVGHLKELFEVKFESVDDQLALGERQRVEQKSDTEKAIQAALTAQKEAVAAQAQSFSESVAKSENATTKQLDQMQTTNKVEIGAVTKSLDELRNEITILRATKLGGQESRAGLIAAVGIGITILLAVIAVAGFLVANPPG